MSQGLPGSDGRHTRVDGGRLVNQSIKTSATWIGRARSVWTAPLVAAAAGIARAAMPIAVAVALALPVANATITVALARVAAIAVAGMAAAAG